MLSNFIRRNGKRKGNKVIGLRSHHKSSSEPSRVPLPVVLDIHEESLAAWNSPVVELNLSHPNEEWFPKDLLQIRSCSPSPLQDATVTQNNLTGETHANPSPKLSLSRSESVSLAPSRKKSIPAPIVIPDYLIPHIQIGHSAVPTKAPTEIPPPNANDTTSNPPLSPVSDNLSSISGTTLARALIGSSFVLSSSEHRSSRHRSGITRQDSATLPRGSFFLSDSGSSSPVPPVPPVPTVLVAALPDQNYPTTIKSGESSGSEYTLSDYLTSPEMANNSVIPWRISRISEVPSPATPIPTKIAPSAVPDTRPQRRVDHVSAHTRVLKNGVFDGPTTAVEVQLPVNSQEEMQHSSQEESVLLSLDEHSLDEFDFVPPEPLVVVASPGSDSSASYIAPTMPLSKRGNAIRGQWKRRGGRLHLVRNGSKVSLADGTLASQQVYGVPSATASEHDYGELLNYDLSLSPGSSASSSSASAGYQTFPETPVVFSPLWSAGYAFLAKSDNQVLRGRLSSMKSAGRGPGKFHPAMRTTKRQVGMNDGGGAIVLRKSRSSRLPVQRPHLPNQAESSLPSSTSVGDGAGILEDETGQLSTTNGVRPWRSDELLSVIRPHPLTRVSSSSSYVLEEEALQALAKYSPSSLPSVTVGEVNPLFDPATDPVSNTNPSVESPASFPLPESTDVSPFNSPALGGSSTMVSSSESPLQLSLPTVNAATSQSHPSLSPPSSSLGVSSFLPSASPPSSSEGSRAPSPEVTASPPVAEDYSVTHSPSPSFTPPPPYHTAVSERTAHISTTYTPALSRTSSAEPGHQRSRLPFNSSLASSSVMSRVRSRPPLPIGPRKPSGPRQASSSISPPIRTRNGSASSVTSDIAGNPKFTWRKLHSAASKSPPKFHAPPPKWRGLTLEAALWTFTSAQLQEIVSQAIRQSSEGSALRFLRPDILEGEIAEEMQRLELQCLDVKAQYKALARKRWILMGALAGHVEGVEMSDTTTAVRTVEELAEVLSALDGLTDKMHDTVLRMAQLKSLCDVHNTSALAMAVRKINALFVRQIAEKEQLQEQVDTLRTERDEAWKHAEDIAQDYDKLGACGCADVRAPNGDASSATSSKRSTRISAVRKSSIRQSQAGLRSRSRHRRGRSLSNATRPTSLALDDIPPVPRLPAMGPSALTGISHPSAYGATSAALALAEAQREVYEMLGLSLSPSQASSRRRTLSGSAVQRPPSPKSRPTSESLDVRGRSMRRVLSRQEWDERPRVRSLTIAVTYTPS